jgi:serine phosphatase RsbU (regulator of sigma subunit)/catechol 2,3-dioxygenase-like lactoylglutathione lyase family enzyme
MASFPDRPFDSDPVRLDRDRPYLRLQAVTVFVRDLDRAVEFYRDQLGFHVAWDSRPAVGQPSVAVAPPDGSAVLRLFAPGPASQAQDLIGRPTGVTFLTEDVLATFREWRARGVRFPYTPRLRRTRPGLHSEADHTSDSTSVWGGTFARFEDPDGNIFHLVGIDQVSRDLEAQRRAIAEKQEAERRTLQELEIARQVQSKLFPQRMPPAGTLEYAGICMQARKVGGDYYDYLDLGRDRLGLVIADIAGKGIAAALLMANLQANLRSQCALAFDHPGRFLESVNQLFCENTVDAAYATLFFGEYDISSQRLCYANCGHLSPLLFRSDGGLERLSSTTTVLGLFKRWQCEISECRLGAGDTLVLYTDGVTEACNDQGEDFGEDRLVDSVRRSRELAPASLLPSIVDEVQRFSTGEQQDDITVIVARCR